MYGHEISITVDDFINKVQYPIEVPEYALPKHELFEHGVLQQFSISDKNTVVLTRATIAMMIDFCFRKIPFKIIVAADIAEIYNYLQEYNRQLSAYEQDVASAADYLIQSRTFFEALEKSMKILAKRNPDLRKVVNREKLTSLFDRPF